MKVNYKYAGSSVCATQGGHTTLGLSPDLSRDEKVSFRGRLKNPLVFRDAMLMLRQIVISDSRQKKKERVEFFQWLNQEIDRRIIEHEQYLPDVRDQLQSDMKQMKDHLDVKDGEIAALIQLQKQIKKHIDSYDCWKDYHSLERTFWQYIKSRDIDLWFVLDPVITVHPDQVTFEAFSVDESVYGCLSIPMAEFEMLTEPKLGTTNIDFSAQLAKEMERFRTYSEVELSVNPDGFTVDTGIISEHIEKKIDLPETWIKGFNQVSAAASLSGLELQLSPVDMYDICSFMRRHKADHSPRYMKWVLEKAKPIRIVFEPFGTELVLRSIYTGDKNREERVWGRRRWLVIENLLPIAQSFQIRLLGFGMPQFIVADLGSMKMTIGFSAWSANDWVKGTAFNIMSGFIGEGNYPAVYQLLKEKRALSVDLICQQLSSDPKTQTIAGIGHLLKKGEAYFDAVSSQIRFRQLCSEPIPAELYSTTEMEWKVKDLVDQGLEQFSIKLTENQDFVFINTYDSDNTELIIDADGQLTKVSCSCKAFKKGPRNISAPCSHILALYMVAGKFTRLKLEPNREYKINDIMEMLL